MQLHKRLRLILDLFAWVGIFMLPFVAIAQIDSTIVPAINEDLIEDYIQNSESEGEFDFNTIFEELEPYLKKPLNINKASKQQLEELNLLNDIQINDLLNHRTNYGDLIALQELQAIPSFDLLSIQNLLPYVGVSGGLDDFQVPLLKMVYQGKNEIFVRWQRILEQQKGYTPLDSGQTGSRYLGDPNKYYMRFRHTYDNRLSFGFTAEKDRGEEFFTGSNKQGFDFYSAHFALKDYNKTIKDLTLGDYAVSMGQGLILYSGFGAGKSSQVMNIRRVSRTLRRYSSVDEANFMRGAGITLGLAKNLELSTFASYRGRDANVIAPDTIGVDFEEGFNISSLQISGNHRTQAEIDDENAIQQFTTGAVLKYQTNNYHFAFNALYNKLSAPLDRTPYPFNLYYFRGDELLNLSVDYSYIFQNLHFFGETAMSDNGRIATVNGLLMGLDKSIDFAILHRKYARDYHALNSNPFGESTGANNEEGIYLGVEFKPTRRWRISAYYDIYNHPWLRSIADAPSKGNEVRGRITYYVKRKMTVYLEVRNETKEQNARNNETNIDFLVPTQLLTGKLHFANKLSKSLELRSRFNAGFYNNGTDANEVGYMFYQDVLYKPVGFPINITARFAIFNTDSYNIRFYHFENDLLYSFAVPAYAYKGTRFYINLRYKGIRNMTLEARLAQTYRDDSDIIGSALEEIQGNTKTEVKAQIKYQF